MATDRGIPTGGEVQDGSSLYAPDRAAVPKPPVPTGCEPRASINGWELDPKSQKNGHCWVGPAGESSVAVYASGGTAYAAVSDDRLTGLGRSRRLAESSYPFEKPTLTPADPEADGKAVATALEAAVGWMERHSPPWRHPDVEEAAFDPPVGYVLDRYYLREHSHEIAYRRAGSESRAGLNSELPTSEPSLQTRRYLYVEVQRGSGDVTIAVAPWLQATGDETHTVAEPPAGCGTGIALKRARTLVQEATGRSRASPPAGQQGLSRFDSYN